MVAAEDLAHLVHPIVGIRRRVRPFGVGSEHHVRVPCELLSGRQVENTTVGLRHGAAVVPEMRGSRVRDVFCCRDGFRAVVARIAGRPDDENLQIITRNAADGSAVDLTGPCYATRSSRRHKHHHADGPFRVVECLLELMCIAGKIVERLRDLVAARRILPLFVE